MDSNDYSDDGCDVSFTLIIDSKSNLIEKLYIWIEVYNKIDE